MKWSEQMRVLHSEDEHYNQLMYDTDESALYLNNKKLIDNLQLNIIENGGVPINCLFYDDAIEIIKKYPFFTDIKFLLNCIFRERISSGFVYSKPFSVKYKKYSTGTWLLVTTDESTFGIEIDLKENTHKPE